MESPASSESGSTKLQMSGDTKYGEKGGLGLGYLIPPFRLSIVEEGLFRGAYPRSRNLRFLKRLKLKTLISLLPNEPSKDLKDFCAQYNITHLSYPIKKPKDEITISPSLVAQILEICIEPKNLPLYIHCLDGAIITGVVCMCLRKLQNWNLSVTFTEYTRFTRSHSISSAESEFVETFKAEIRIPRIIPQWLWQGIIPQRHPTLKLKLPEDTNATLTMVDSMGLPTSAGLKKGIISKLSKPSIRRSSAGSGGGIGIGGGAGNLSGSSGGIALSLLGTSSLSCSSSSLPSIEDLTNSRGEPLLKRDIEIGVGNGGEERNNEIISIDRVGGIGERVSRNVEALDLEVTTKSSKISRKELSSREY
jgi:tyrosine-protein phosphatase OCA6